MEYSAELKSMQQTNREMRQQMAQEAGVAEGVMAGWGLGPTMAGFFSRLRPYATEDQDVTFDEGAAIANWRDKDDARALIEELEFRDLLEQDDDGNFRITDLGRVAIDNLRSIS